MIDIQLPRLLNSSLNGIERTIRPISMSVNLSITPLSYASMELPRGEGLPARGYVEIYTGMGFAGVFRVRSPQDAYGEDTTTAELEHAIVEVGDYIVLNEYKEMMSASNAMRTVFSHYRGNKWRLGDVSALGNDEIALQTDHDRVLEAMLAILDQKPDCMMTFDFSTSPWTVAVAKRGTVVQAEGRLSRNINSAKVTYDDTELVTRCYYEYSVEDSSGETTNVWAYVDTDTMSQYGLVERSVPTGSGYTQAEARRTAVAYAEKHKRPRVSVSISAEELSAITGESFDAFSVGKLCRLALLDYNVTIEQVVTSLSWKDVFGAPEDITVSLEDEEDTTVTFLHDLDAKGRIGGGGANSKRQDDSWKEYRTKVDDTDKYVELLRVHVDENNRILEQAGLYLDSDGILIYADDNPNMVGSRFNVQASRLYSVVGVTEETWDRWNGVSLSTISGSTMWQERNSITNVVGQFTVETDQDGTKRVVIQSGGGLKIKRDGTEFGVYDSDNLTAGIMIKKINGDQAGDSEAIIKASKVDLGAYATVGRLEAEIADLDTVYAKSADVASALAGEISCMSLGANTVSGTNVEGSIATFASCVVNGYEVGDASILKGTPTSSPNGGQITLTFPTLGGGTTSVNFNIADTQYYKDGVAAAKQSALNQVYVAQGAWSNDGKWTKPIYAKHGEEQLDSDNVSALSVYEAGRRQGRQEGWDLARTKFHHENSETAVSVSGPAATYGETASGTYAVSITGYEASSYTQEKDTYKASGFSYTASSYSKEILDPDGYLATASSYKKESVSYSASQHSHTASTYKASKQGTISISYSAG